jgi:hypothetical protein
MQSVDFVETVSAGQLNVIVSMYSVTNSGPPNDK